MPTSSRPYGARAALAGLLLLVSALAAAWLLAAADPAGSAFPGSNGKIAFERGGGIFTMTASGRRERPVPNTGGASDPVWSRDGRMLAIEESADPVTGGEKIAVVNADGSGRHKVTDGSDPTWSRDGRRIAFEDAGSIFVVNADGSGRRLVVADGDAPAWSPNGKAIAFTRKRAGNTDIFVISPNGGGLRRVTSAAAKDDEPDWSPDGRKLAFVSDRRGSENVFVMSSRGTSVRQLTRYKAGTEGDDPAWSPDGRRIAFERSTSSGEAVFVMSARGTRLKRLTSGSNPDWQSLR